MKISGKQLEAIMFKLKYAMIGYSSETKDFEIDIKITEEDPGNGIMTDAVTLTSCKSDDDRVETMSIELYSQNAEQEPRISETKSYRMKKP